MSTEFNIIQAQDIYRKLYDYQIRRGLFINESQEAILFVKALYIQKYGDRIVFCDDKDFFVNKTPTGYAVTGLYKQNNGVSQPFNITVRKNEGNWYTSSTYVAPDTKSCSSYILLWILIMIGCSLLGLVSYWMLKAAIGF